MTNIVFLDEAGNLNLEIRDEAFPLLALTMLVVDQQYYARTITPAFAELNSSTSATTRSSCIHVTSARPREPSGF
ncbi:MAG: hypothetical protein NTX53_05260 [candidate division WOR-3 bacterium]|nr:hypothetical protein [candidate division WOR-3 bacterium]